ncbi:uncharacterized protein LOC144951166 [Lampetra fluviatilis]
MGAARAMAALWIVVGASVGATVPGHAEGLTPVGPGHRGLRANISWERDGALVTGGPQTQGSFGGREAPTQLSGTLVVLGALSAERGEEGGGGGWGRGGGGGGGGGGGAQPGSHPHRDGCRWWCCHRVPRHRHRLDRRAIHGLALRAAPAGRDGAARLSAGAAVPPPPGAAPRRSSTGSVTALASTRAVPAAAAAEGSS